MTGRYAFSSFKLSKMFGFFSVALALSLIYPRPLGENFSFALEGVVTLANNLLDVLCLLGHGPIYVFNSYLIFPF